MAKKKSFDLYSGQYAVAHIDDPSIAVFVARTLGEANAFVEGAVHGGAVDANQYEVHPVEKVSM